MVQFGNISKNYIYHVISGQWFVKRKKHKKVNIVHTRNAGFPNVVDWCEFYDARATASLVIGEESSKIKIQFGVYICSPEPSTKHTVEAIRGDVKEVGFGYVNRRRASGTFI